MTREATEFAGRFAASGYDWFGAGDCLDWVGGEWVGSASGEWIEVSNPRHGRAMGRVTRGGAAEVDRAVQVAKAAQVQWASTPLKERAQVLYRLKGLMEERLDELSWIVSHENGKIFPEAKAEVLKAIECLELAAGVPNALQGGRMEVSRGVHCAVSYEPLGVVGIVAPFNFPVMVPMWMIPLALIAGNALIVKPSEKVPYGVAALASLCGEAGLPAGILNTTNGGRETVERIVDHPDVKAVSFVGSTPVARALYVRGTALSKRMLCLGGAKNHLIVVPDADVELTASNVVASSFGCAGQRCMAASVLVAVGDSQHIVDAIAAKARELVLGDTLGPVIDSAAVERIESAITRAEGQGAEVLVDGRGAQGPAAGTWVGATVIDGVTPEMPAGCDEIFGPVLSVMRTRTLDEALAIENANPFGNAASIYTTSGYTAEYASARFEAGMCGVNIGVPVPREPFAFGGWNDSKFGHGDVTGYEGYRFFSRARKVTSKWAEQSDKNWMS